MKYENLCRLFIEGSRDEQNGTVHTASMLMSHDNTMMARVVMSREEAWTDESEIYAIQDAVADGARLLKKFDQEEAVLYVCMDVQARLFYGGNRSVLIDGTEFYKPDADREPDWAKQAIRHTVMACAASQEDVHKKTVTA